MDKMKLIVLDNIKETGYQVDEHLKQMNNSKSSYIMNITRSRFNNGEGKIRINEEIRDKDVFILSDIGNYGITYKMHGMNIPMTPDEHFQDIKRCISALSGHASRITVIMPLLYQSRQDKRIGKESLDCAIALQELDRLNVNSIITFDCHNESIANAIPNLPFENILPTNIILEAISKKEKASNLLVISPDIGGMERARYYADMLKCDVGVFYKRRDLSKIVNGQNPIVEHAYMGADVKDKTIIVVDDMIASGNSMIEVGKKLKDKGVKQVFFVATFALFTDGIEKFEKAYKDEIFDKLYTTNLSYIPKTYTKYNWFEKVNCSKRLAEIIDCIHKSKSLDHIINDNEKIIRILKENKYLEEK